MNASAKPIDILLVEDNTGDIELTRCVFADSGLENPLHVVGSGAEALDFIGQRGPYAGAPRADLLLLDLHLPEIDGAELTRLLRQDPANDDMPIIMLTGSQMDKEIAAISQAAADYSVAKPLTLASLLGAIRALDSFWSGRVRFDAAHRAITRYSA